jgi:hypothetical protein
MQALLTDPGAAPTSWIVVFSEECDHPLGRWVPGRFKHVRAVGCLVDLDAWLFYDLHIGGTDILVLRGAAAAELLARWAVRAVLLRVPARRPRARRFFGWPQVCTTAVAHLIGAPGSALRPTALWRDLVRAGATPIENPYGYAALRPAADRSEPEAAAAAGS